MLMEVKFMSHGLLVRLKEQKPFASPAERNIIDYIQGDPRAVMSLSIRGLAEATFTSPSTIVRFCRKLGCSGYKEFQRELVFEFAASQERMDIALDDVDQDDDAAAIIEKVTRSDMLSIEATSRLLDAIGRTHGYKQRYIVRFNDRIVPVNTSDIAYFYSEEKNTWMVTSDNNRYVMDLSLDILSEELDARSFFRISRNCIISMAAISSVVKYLGNRLKIQARPRPDFEMVVSRSRVEDFLRWLEGGA